MIGKSYERENNRSLREKKRERKGKEERKKEKRRERKEKCVLLKLLNICSRIILDD